MTTIEAERSSDERDRPLHLRRIDVRAAVIVGGVFSAILGFAFLLAGWFVVAVASQRGLLDQVNSVSNDLSSGHPRHIGAVQLCLVWTAVVVAWTVAMTAVIGLSATIFNSVLRLSGGIELDLSPTAPARPQVFTTTARRLATTAARVRTQTAKVGAQTAKRLRQLDWSALSFPAGAKPAHDGVDPRASTAARARSVVAARDEDEDSSPPTA